MSADKCSINYLTELNNNDKKLTNSGGHVTNQNYQQICKPPSGGETTGCTLEVNGVNKIIIDNADNGEVKKKHKFHPDNIYTIDSNPTRNDVKKPIYHDPNFKVLWSNQIKNGYF